MAKRGSLWAAVVVGLGAFLLPGVACADPPATANKVQLGLGFRYGIDMDDGDFNLWGVGLGLDGGYTLPNAIYVGGTFDYFFGDTVEAAGFKSTGNVWQLMAEGGYDVGIGPSFVIRPKLGLGVGFINGESCLADQCSSDSESGLALAPGATFMFFTEKFGLSLDLRYDMILHDPDTKALVFNVGVGF